MTANNLICREFAPMPSMGNGVISLWYLSDSHRAALLSNPWFAEIEDSVQYELISRMRKRMLTPEQRLFSRGDESDGVYAVVEGTVRLSGISRDGRETVFDFYGPGSWFGEVCVFDGRPRIHDAEAHGTAVLLQIDPAEVETLIVTRPSLSRAFLKLEAQRLRVVMAALESFSAQSLEQRLATRLLLLAERYGSPTTEGVKIQLHLPQEMLAKLIGSTRQRVNQILKEWEAEGMVRQQYGRVTLLQVDRLSRLAQL